MHHSFSSIHRLDLAQPSLSRHRKSPCAKYPHRRSWGVLGGGPLGPGGPARVPRTGEGRAQPWRGEASCERGHRVVRGQSAKEESLSLGLWEIKLPTDLGTPQLKLKRLLESNPLKSRLSVPEPTALLHYYIYDARRLPGQERRGHQAPIL